MSTTLWAFVVLYEALSFVHLYVSLVGCDIHTEINSLTGSQNLLLLEWSLGCMLVIRGTLYQRLTRRGWVIFFVFFFLNLHCR